MMNMWLRLLLFSSLVSATIYQNQQVRTTSYRNTQVPTVTGRSGWNTYQADAPELSYKGRWDDKHISWWSAPGLKFGFRASNVAITFGNNTSDEVLIAYRIDGQDWMLTNVTASSTHLVVQPTTKGYNLTTPTNATQIFELRVTNWAYGVQIDNVSVYGGDAKLVPIPNYTRNIELIGDSLSAGQYATLEGISSYSWGLLYGLGNVEFSVTAYPGICTHDSNCYGNPHGQAYQWYKTSDVSYRAQLLYGENPPDWDFSAHPAADITLINLGTNDNNTVNNITTQQFVSSYIQLIQGVHQVWPDSQIICISLWNGFNQVGNTWVQGGAFVDEIPAIVQSFSPTDGSYPFVHYFNTTGILQHNDIGPLYHPTDVGAVKLASHLMQYIKLTFGWDFEQTGPEVQHDTLYWNDQTSY